VNRKWWIAIGGVVVVGALVWANLRQLGTQPAAGGASGNGPKNAPLVKVVKVVPRDLTQTVLAPGTLEVTTPQQIVAPFASKRLTLMVGLGDTVTAGQVLAELDDADLKLQVANQQAQVARAQLAAAQAQQQLQTGPFQLQQKLENARAQAAQAEQGLATALRQTGTARQRVEQARATLLSVQNRIAQAGGTAVQAARAKLQQAETEYYANPLDAAARKALDDARTAYLDALKSAGDQAKQNAAELANALEVLKSAEADLTDAEGGDPAAVSQAKSQLAAARAALEAAQVEAKGGGTLAEQARSAELDLAAARATLDSLKQKLAAAQIKAPGAGTVLSIALKSGQPVQEGQLVLELGAMDTLTVKARVDEIDVAKLKPGQSLWVKSNAYPTEKFTGKVTRVAAQTTQVAGQSGGSYYEVQGEVANGEAKLRSGMSAETHITTETRSKVLVVGLEAVREEADKATVLVVKDFKVEVRPVKLGLRTQTEVEITEGLKEGEQVIVSPFTLISSFKGGEAVRVEVTQPAAREEGP